MKMGSLISVKPSAQTLCLALAPFPRGPNADPLARESLKSEEEAGPFGVLAALKDKLP